VCRCTNGGRADHFFTLSRRQKLIAPLRVRGKQSTRVPARSLSRARQEVAAHEDPSFLSAEYKEVLAALRTCSVPLLSSRGQILAHADEIKRDHANAPKHLNFIRGAWDRRRSGRFPPPSRARAQGSSLTSSWTSTS
jgi:hypothetical protein